MVNPNVKTSSLGVYKLVKPPVKSPGVPNLNWKQLTKFCRMKINSFEQYAKRYDTAEGPFFYKDNGADILAVAHLDYVLGPLHTSMLKLSDDHLFFCPTLDDRAGVYAILDYLPSKGLKYDILLTTNEEKCNSTAAYFTPPPGKKYRFIFSFDRRGTDVVMYNYHNSKSQAMLKECGWNLGIGTYSDIADLEHLRCKGFNFGVGYYEEHTARCHLSRNHFLLNMRRFLSFYNKHINDWMPHTPMYNSYSVDEGFGYLYTNYGQSQHTFTDEDIEVLESIEKDGFDFGSQRVTPDNIKGVIQDYQKSLKEVKTVEANEKSRQAQEEFEFAYNDATYSGSQVNKSKIKKLSLGSEDNPDFDQSRKIENAEKQEAVAGLEPAVATVIHTDNKELIGKLAASAADANAVPIGVDECSQCHQPTSFKLGTNSTLCPACQSANASKSQQTESRKCRIIAKASLFKPGDDDATYEYVEDKEGGKGWQWVGHFPQRVAA